MRTRARAPAAIVFAASTLVSLAGCGYVGEPLPPALKRPARVTDLAAVERGSKIVIQFTVPKVTTEDLPIEDKPDIELRIGSPGADGFNMQAWEHDSDRVAEIPQNDSLARVEVDASKYYGKTVIAAVNVHGPHERSAGWSNFAILNVIPALPVPQGLVASDVPDAVQLEWRAAAPEFRVFRKAPEEPNWTQIGTSMSPSYIDRMIEYGRTYQYFVQSVEKTGDAYVESELPTPITYKPMDRFPPAVPVGLTAVPAVRSIELVWERNTEKDFASYRVYRNGQRIAEGLTAPVYGDRDVQAGMKYQYQVTAVDTANNESPKSDPVETIIP